MDTVTFAEYWQNNRVAEFCKITACSCNR